MASILSRPQCEPLNIVLGNINVIDKYNFFVIWLEQSVSDIIEFSCYWLQNISGYVRKKL